MYTFMASFSRVGAYYQKRVNPKIVLAVGHILMLSSILIASFMQTWWTFVVFYAILFPIGAGICYWVPIMCGWEWFPERKGLVSGLILAGFGFSSFIFGFITTAIANPHDLTVRIDYGSGSNDKLFPEEVANRVPEMFRYCLIPWSLLGLAAIFTVTRNPDYLKQEEVRKHQEKFYKENLVED